MMQLRPDLTPWGDSQHALECSTGIDYSEPRLILRTAAQNGETALVGKNQSLVTGLKHVGGINPAGVTLVRNGDDLTIAVAKSSAGLGDAGSILVEAPTAMPVGAVSRRLPL